MSAQRLVLWVLCALACLSICDHFTAQAACPSCFVMEKHPNCTKDAKLVKSRDGCPGGVKYEHCGCCKVCLKLKGESCRGGQHAWEGFCDPDQNLECSASGNETGGICVRKWEIFVVFAAYTKFMFVFFIIKFCKCIDIATWVQGW